LKVLYRVSGVFVFMAEICWQFQLWYSLLICNKYFR